MMRAPFLICMTAALLVRPLLSIGQVVQHQAAEQSAGSQATVRLNLRGDVDLRALVEYVGKRLNLSFVYDDDVARKRVNVRAPDEIPVESLLNLLGSVLKMEGMILVEDEIPGWLRIVDSAEMSRLSKPSTGREGENPATPVTQMFGLENMDPQQLLTLLRPFLTEPGGNAIALADTDSLIITDYVSVVDNVATLINMLDRGRGTTEIRYYRVQHAIVRELVSKVTEALNSPATKVVGVDETQVVAVVGIQPHLGRAIEFLERFDVPVDRTVKVHRFTNIRAERAEAILEGMLEGEAWARFTITADKDANLLVIRATTNVHEIFDKLITELDQPTETPSTPLRFYKLQNAKAIEVFFTLQALQQLSVPPYPNAMLGYPGMGFYGGPSPTTPYGAFSAFGSNAAVFPGGMLGRPGLMNAPSMAGFGVNNLASMNSNEVETTPLPLPLQPETPESTDASSQERLDQISSAALSQLSAAAGTATLPGGARVSVDIASNSLILVAPNEVHRMYEQIIKKLDVRRPQVLIEVQIIAIDTSDRFQLGVEISGGDRTGDRRLFKFTSFGLSEVDPTDGSLSLRPGLGFNGALVDPSVADVILQALVTHSRARVLSSPQILVNDNSRGMLKSSASIPFQSVNASNTVSTTSLGGNQEAGTSLTVRPQINEGDHLHLEFDLEFSTFEGEVATTPLPPPRQIDRIQSQITIPNGHTVIVGGLNRWGEQDSFTGVPWLERIPIVREISSLRSEQNDSTSFFLFIRPNILRDDQFRDLKHLSKAPLDQSGGMGDYPRSGPIMMKR